MSVKDAQYEGNTSCFTSVMMPTLAIVVRWHFTPQYILRGDGHIKSTVGRVKYLFLFQS